VALAGLALATTAHAQQDVTWDDQCPFAWEAVCSGGGTNWDNDQFPTPADHAIIIDADEVRINSATGQVVDRLTLIDSTLNGVINIFTDATVIGSAFSGRMESLGPVDFVGDCTFGGTMRGPGIFTNQGTFLYNNGFIGDAVGTVDFDNFGTLNIAFGPSVGAGSTLTNLATIDFTNGNLNGPGLFVNFQTARMNKPAGLSVIGCEYHQTGGSVEALAGTLRFGGKSTLAGGTLNAQLGGEIDLVSSFEKPINVTEPTTATGTGSVSLRGGGSGMLTLDAPFTFNVQAPGGGLLQGNTTLNADLNNSGYLLITGTHVTAGGGAIVNQAGGVMETFVNNNTQLITDAPVINRGVLVTPGPIGSKSGGPVGLTNESGALWQMYRFPGNNIDVMNRGDITHDRYNGNGLGSGAITGRLDQDSGSLASTVDDIFLDGGGTWSGTSSATVSDEAELIFRNSDWEFAGDPVTLTTAAPAGFNEATILFGDTASYEVSGRLVLNGDQRSGFEHPPITIVGTVRGFGTVENIGELNVADPGRLGTPSNDFGTFKNSGRVVLFGLASPDPFITMTVENTGRVEVQGPLTIANNQVQNDGEWYLLNGGFALTQAVTHEFQNSDTFISDTLLSDPPIETSNTHNGPFNNAGTVIVRRNTNLVFDGDVRQVQGGILTGGTWVVEPNCQLIFVEPIQIVGPATVYGSTDQVPQLTQADGVDTGTVEFGAPGLLNERNLFEVSNGGTLRSTDGSPIGCSGLLRNGLPPAPGSPVNDQSSLEYLEQLGGGGGGGGRSTNNAPADPSIIAEVFENNAILNPGTGGATIGLRIQADTTFSSSSEVIIDLAGLVPCTEHDQLIIDGPLASDGTIVVRFAPGYEPGPDDTFTVASADSVQGVAPRVVSPAYATNKRLAARIVGNTIELAAACAADFNADGVLDTGDIGAFVDAFLASEPVADFSGDGVLDLGDISAFVAAFLAGC